MYVGVHSTPRQCLEVFRNFKTQSQRFMVIFSNFKKQSHRLTIFGIMHRYKKARDTLGRVQCTRKKIKKHECVVKMDEKKIINHPKSFERCKTRISRNQEKTYQQTRQFFLLNTRKQKVSQHRENIFYFVVPSFKAERLFNTLN